MKQLILNIVLFVVAILLLVMFTPLAVVAKIIYSICRRSLDTKWVMRLAISLDQFGNVLADDLFNFVLLNRRSKAKFGDEDETISSVLGKNELAKTLTIFGKGLSGLLGLFDKNHSVNSIED